MSFARRGRGLLQYLVILLLKEPSPTCTSRLPCIRYSAANVLSYALLRASPTPTRLTPITLTTPPQHATTFNSGFTPKGPCPGHDAPAGDGPSHIDTWCAVDEVDDHFYDQTLANATIKNLEYAAPIWFEQKKPFFIMNGFARPHAPWRVPKRIWYLTDARVSFSLNFGQTCVGELLWLHPGDVRYLPTLLFSRRACNSNPSHSYLRYLRDPAPSPLPSNYNAMLH